jgi:hypothetical protein
MGVEALAMQKRYAVVDQYCFSEAKFMATAFPTLEPGQSRKEN